MRKTLLLLAYTLLFSVATAQTIDYSLFDKKFNFYVVNDMGRNGYYDQKPIAELMGTMAEEVGPEFVLATGDVHHFEGVQSTADPLWLTNYELIYSHPELMIPWYPLLGNHEYRGNTEAVLDYTRVSRRWEMSARYYTKTFDYKGTTLRILWIDTTPMIDRYRTESDTYPDACQQDYEAQLAWIDSVLTAAHEDWVIVAGHHPVYAETPKEESERTDLQNRLEPILRRHKVDMYINGHIHNFQHLRTESSDTDYITNSAASLARKVKPAGGMLFCSPATGFSIVSFNRQSLELRMIDRQGNVLHTVRRDK